MSDNPYSGFFEQMWRGGIPHYDSDEHCWCKPTVITLALDYYGNVESVLIFHNYAVPLTEREMHSAYRKSLRSAK
jgi:hypothetical protein